MMRRLLLVLCAASATAAGQAAPPARHVIFVTIDGVRAEDLFGGADPVVMADPEGSGIADTAAFRARWWRDTPEARRRAVMPFLWDTLVPMGVLTRGRVDNGLNFSAPGYMAMFSGHPRGDVTSNADRRYQWPTIFTVVASQPGSDSTDAAAFVSWTTQARLTAPASGVVVANGPFESLPAGLDGRAMVLTNRLEAAVHHPDATIRYDAFTHELALAWLDRYHPMLLHVGYGETDIEAHERRYDRYLAMLHETDRMLSELWHHAQADPALGGTTALVVTTDHGRGATARDWTDHGRDVANAARWWFLAAGAGVGPAGEVHRGTVVQSQVGPTILALLGIDPASLAAPVSPVFRLAGDSGR